MSAEPTISTDQIGAAIAAAMVAHSVRPAPVSSVVLRWIAGIVSALLVMAIGGSGAWLINTVNNMQQTLVRVDERTKAQADLIDARGLERDRRIAAIEDAVMKLGAKQ